MYLLTRSGDLVKQEAMDLLEANLQYAHIRKLDGSKATVSLNRLVPKGPGESKLVLPLVIIPIKLPMWGKIK